MVSCAVENDVAANGAITAGYYRDGARRVRQPRVLAGGQGLGKQVGSLAPRLLLCISIKNIDTISSFWVYASGFRNL